MERVHYLAAEIFAYSYDNYANHLGVNARFDRLMPASARTLEQAEREHWPDERLARALEIELSAVPEWRARYREAVEVVDAETPAAAFRSAVRQCITRELGHRNLGDAEVESLVKQICYRAADLSYVLAQEQKALADYSTELRAED